MNKLVSRLTGDPFNHVSLSFDRALTTLVSCHGGNDQQTPGVNHETVDGLLARQGASFMGIEVDLTTSQKARLLEELVTIDAEGSSYNVAGLLTKRAAKPNIMFCSQFVYRLLSSVGLVGFADDPCRVRPSDFQRHLAGRRLDELTGTTQPTRSGAGAAEPMTVSQPSAPVAEPAGLTKLAQPTRCDVDPTGPTKSAPTTCREAG
jgi:hypothetical protein